MITGLIEQDFRRTVCEDLRLISEGNNRFRVSTPFTFDDGDHLIIALKCPEGQWVLSDEGHTYMRLTYDLDESDLHRGTRQEIISNALDAFSVEDRNGELVVPILDGRYGDALYSFIQAILKISDVTFLSRERARSTFLEDVRSLMEERVPPQRLNIDWHHPTRDREGIYAVDYCINSMQHPLFLHALPNDSRTRDATISLLKFEQWGVSFRSMAIFENQIEINPKVLARFTDICEKTFSSLSVRDRIETYLANILT